MTDNADVIGQGQDDFASPQGTYEEAKQLLGVKSPANFGSRPVDATRIQQYCALIEDSNTCYWDAPTSMRIWGGEIAPPGMLQSWMMPLPWAPGRSPQMRFMLLDLPLPGTSLINVSTECVYHRPIYAGETLNSWDEATAISEEKETRLGIGHFVTTVGHLQTQDGEEVATVTNVQFRFTPKGQQ